MDILQTQHIIFIGIAASILILYAIYKLDKPGRQIGIYFSLQASLIKVLQVVYNDLIGFWKFIFTRPLENIAEKFNERQFNLFISFATGLAIIIAIFSFAGTYKASSEYAIEHGFGLASYFIPISVDLLVVMLGLVTLAYSFTGSKKPGYVGLGIIISVLISGYFNVLHAFQQGNSQGFETFLLGAIFPISLGVSIELVATLIIFRVKRTTLIDSNEQLKDRIKDLQSELQSLQSEIASGKETLSDLVQRIENRKAQSRKKVAKENEDVSTRDKVSDLLVAGKEVKEIATALNVSTQTVYNYRKELQLENGKVA
jgi:hypothetical protein